MGAFQTLMALVVAISSLSVIVRAMQEVLESLFKNRARTMVRTTLRLGVFMLLALPVVQGQTANPTPPAADKKAVDKKAVDKKAADKKAADKKSTVKNAGPGAPQGTPSAAEGSKADAAKTTPPVRLENARLDAADSDYANMSLRDCVPGQPDSTKIVCDGKAFHLKVNDKGLRAQLKQFHVGDHVRVDINADNELQDIHGAWSYPQEGINAGCRLLVLAACAFGLLGLAALATRGSPLKLIVGLDNRYSNSKFQVALWFWILISTYIATVLFRVWYAGWDFFGRVDIPQNLLVLSGLSALTFGGAKAITAAKVDAAAHPVAPPGAIAPPAPNLDPKNARAPGQENFFKDLVQDDNEHFDFGDFQMLVVTMVAVVMYLMLVFHFLESVEFLKKATLPDVDSTILAGFGLGQGAYLAKKAGGNPGTS